MKKLFLILMFLPLCSFANESAKSTDKIQVATTTTDLAAIVKAVGKDKVQVFAIAKGTQDPHQIEAKPSYMVKLRQVDLVIAHGLELESAWLNSLVRGARNEKLNKPGAILELAAQLNPIEVPKGKITRADGDVHPGGNPHFQLDPIRVGQAALIIANKLSEYDPSHKDFFLTQAKNFQQDLESKTKQWQERIKKSGIHEVVTYHKSFSYFCDRFSITCDIQLEPKPGIPPTASHLLTVIQQIQERKIKLVLIENLYDDSVGDKLKSKIPDLKIVKAPISVGGEPGLDTNAELIENIVQIFEKASR